MKTSALFLLLSVALCLQAKSAMADKPSTEYRSLLDKASSGNTVTQKEVIRGANALAKTLCQDAYFQESGGSSSAECLEKLEKTHAQCESMVFEKQAAHIRGKAAVVALARAYVACTGGHDCKSCAPLSAERDLRDENFSDQLKASTTRLRFG